MYSNFFKSPHTNLCRTLLALAYTNNFSYKQGGGRKYTQIFRKTARKLFQMEPTLKVATGSCWVIVAAFRLSGVRKDKTH